jgi:hypothetical protein
LLGRQHNSSSGGGGDFTSFPFSSSYPTMASGLVLAPRGAENHFKPPLPDSSLILQKLGEYFVGVGGGGHEEGHLLALSRR